MISLDHGRTCDNFIAENTQGAHLKSDEMGGVDAADPASIAAVGEKIYVERYKTSFEAEHHGKLVVIDVHTGIAYIGESPIDAHDKARAGNPNGVFHLIRVGSDFVYSLRSPRF